MRLVAHPWQALTRHCLSSASADASASSSGRGRSVRKGKKGIPPTGGPRVWRNLKDPTENFLRHSMHVKSAGRSPFSSSSA